jgi:YHS domain-containing protein
MNFLLRLLFLVFVFYFLQRVLRALFPGLFTPLGSQPTSPPSAGSAPVVKHGTMEKDPVCGTYVDVAASLKTTIEGHTRYFCSSDCLEKYQKGAKTQ